MQGIQLTDRQNQIWNDVGDSLAASLNIKHLALQYYLEYRQSLLNNKVSINEVQKINNIMRIAYFVSQKNQVVYNMRGQKVIGVALSINQIIKKNKDFQDFFLHLKEMLKVITIENREVENQIESCLKKFKFTMTFHHKFVSTFKKIRPNHPDQILASSLLWLIFILSKQNLHKTADDIIETTCIMAASFIYFLRESIQYFSQQKQYEKNPIRLEDNNYGGVMKNNNEITHVILQYFRIKDMDKYHKIQKSFYDLLNSLKNKIGCDTLFYHSYEKNLDAVYKKMDQVYQKNLTDHNIDERHFLKERINNVLIANRFTPFGGRRHIGKNKNPQPTGQIFSHRILDYEESQTTKASNIDKNDKKQTREKCGSILLKNLVNNRTPTRSTPLIRATPTTNAMQMHNWLLEKSNYFKFDQNQLPIKLILKDGKNAPQNFEDILKLVYGLWKDFCAHEEEYKNEMNSKLLNTLLVISVEIVYFVKNSNQNTLQTLLGNFKLRWIDVWEKIDSVLKYGNGMPRSIKQHLLAVETNIVVKQLWNNEQPPFSIFTNDKQKVDTIGFSDRLYKRTIHEIVYQIFFLSKKLPSIEQNHTNLIFLIAQYAITQNPQILYRRNIYHIILCSFYAISKALDLKLSFSSILTPFTEMNGLSREEYSQLIDQIYLGGEYEIADIVMFYNLVFVRVTKQFLLCIKYKEGPIEIGGSKIINQSVKDLLPKQIVMMAQKKIKSRVPGSPHTPSQTPLTQALLAYNQSPLLKEKRMKNILHCVDGKRLLSKNNSESQKTREETLKQTTALINKKFKSNKSPAHRFGSTIKKTGANNQ